MSAFSAMIKGRCPHCREGDVFKNPSYKILKFKQTHTNCPVCKVKYESEPGFFWGAMYFSYAMNVAMIVILGFIFFVLLESENVGMYMVTLIAVLAFMFPFTFRLSRLLMMYIAAPYRRYRGKQTH